jgi:hypothetical protein
MQYNLRSDAIPGKVLPLFLSNYGVEGFFTVVKISYEVNFS